MSDKKIARMSAQQKAKRLFADILKSKDLHEISQLREEMDFYLDEIERRKLDKQLKADYAALAATTPKTSV